MIGMREMVKEEKQKYNIKRKEITRTTHLMSRKPNGSASQKCRNRRKRHRKERTRTLYYLLPFIIGNRNKQRDGIYRGTIRQTEEESARKKNVAKRRIRNRTFSPSPPSLIRDAVKFRSLNLMTYGTHGKKEEEDSACASLLVMCAGLEYLLLSRNKCST